MQKEKREVSLSSHLRIVSTIFLQQVVKSKTPGLLMFLRKYKLFEHCFQTLFHHDFGTTIPRLAEFP